MNPKLLMNVTIAIFAVFSVWCFVDGFRVSEIEFIGAFSYLLVVLSLLLKIPHSRHIAFTVLVLHIALSSFMLYSAITTNVPTPEEIEDISQSIRNASAPDRIDFISLMTEPRRRFLIVRETAILLPLLFCVYSLANNTVANLLRVKNA